MAKTAGQLPWMDCITTADTDAHSLLTLLQAVDPSVPPHCALLEIYLDQAAPGVLYTGNAEVSTTRWGKKLAVGTSQQFFAQGANDIPLRDIYVLAGNAGATLIGVTIHVI